MPVTAQGVWKFAAGCFALFGAFSAVVFARLRWHAGVDFDVTGFLWLIQNLPRLSALICCIAFLAAALWCLLRAYGSPR